MHSENVCITKFINSEEKIVVFLTLGNGDLKFDWINLKLAMQKLAKVVVEIVVENEVKERSFNGGSFSI